MKKPFKPILVHRIFTKNKDVIVLGKNYNFFRTLLQEKTTNSVVFEHLVKDYVEDFKKQCPETYDNNEHLFFPITREDIYEIETISCPINEKKKKCITMSCFSTSSKQTNEQYVKNFREMCIKGLNNALDYYEFFFRCINNTDGRDTFYLNSIPQEEPNENPCLKSNN